ncbi:MAG: T9SS C-terminal target domain-containing protein [Candidatus Neomarinimicrobiota bacterium]|nr:MAG: T9SS C-terminal target domain-containing protein [Candidatus Neomarinimicrobiota bacterium]
MKTIEIWFRPLRTGLLWIWVCTAFGRAESDGGQTAAWVFFTDKPLATSSQVHLSPKALARRERLNLPAGGWSDRWPADNYVSAVRATGVTLRHRSRWLNAVSVEGTPAQLRTIAAFPFVQEVRPLQVYHFPRLEASGAVAANDHRDREGATLDYGYATEQIQQIQINRLHDLGYSGSGVRVLVMDTGFNLTHPAFDSLQVVSQWDVINDDSVCANENDTEASVGQHNHGTAVLSALAAYKPGELVGPAYGAEFLLAKTEIVDQEIELEEDHYVAGLEWGEARGAQVVSTSLGYLDWYTYCDMDGNTAVVTRAIDHAVTLGLVCVTAMGNEGAGSPPTDPCQDPLTYYMIAPADADSVIAVGAVDSKGNPAYFTSHGPTYDGRIKPEVCARGVLTVAVNPNTDGYLYYNGTSLSTPLIGGATAVLVQAHPDWTPMEVREALIQTASQANLPDNTLGYGIANFWEAYQYGSAGVESDQESVPQAWALIRAWPNPFNDAVTLSLRIQRRGKGTLRLVDMQGREVETITSRWFEPGSYRFRIQWNDRSAGVYFVVLAGPSGRAVRKVIYLP